MAKRNAKRATKRKAKRDRKEQPARCKARLQTTGLYSLPDHLIEEILLWIRPEESNQRYFWRWICQMSATCAPFRRVICSAAPLRPTVLELDSLVTSWGQERTVQLMNTMRRSDWMGAMVQSVHTGGFSDSEYFVAAVDAFMSLLTTPGTLPDLTDVHLSCGTLPNLTNVHLSWSDFLWPILPYRKSFLRDLVRTHPSLTRLALTDGVFGHRSQDYLSPRVFSTLASSLPNLERFEISLVHWLESNHLVAFFSNAGSKLTYLLLDGGNSYSAFTEEVFVSISEHCHNLDTFRAIQCSIPSLEFSGILRSNRHLLHVDLSDTYCDNPRNVLDSIVERTPGLHSFRGNDCDWINDDSIRTLINGQINAFGRILLKELGIAETEVTADGLRSVLTRWIEFSHVPLQIDLLSSLHVADPDTEAFHTLVDDFPEVSFRL